LKAYYQRISSWFFVKALIFQTTGSKTKSKEVFPPQNIFINVENIDSILNDYSFSAGNMIPVGFINGNKFILIDGLFYGLFVKTLIY
jgi:hypothetical protein